MFGSKFFWGDNKSQMTPQAGQLIYILFIDGLFLFVWVHSLVVSVDLIVFKYYKKVLGQLIDHFS